MAEFGTPYRSSEELLESIASMMGDLTEQMLSLAEAMTVVSEESKSVEKSLGDSKTQKGMKSIGGMLKGMAKASVHAFALEQLMKLLEPFLMLLEPLGVIFDILGALLTVFTGEIMQALFSALEPLFDVLIALMPVFKILGQLFGMILKVGLVPLTTIMEVLFTIIKPFLPLLEKFAPIIEVIGTVMSWLIRIGLLPLVAAIYAVGLGIAALINFFTFGVVDAVGSWNSMMLPLLGSMVGLEDGGIVQQEGMFRLGEKGKKEAVIPLEKAGGLGFGGNSEGILSEINENMMIQNQLIKRQSRGINRRKFG